MAITTWKDLITKQMEINGDSWSEFSGASIVENGLHLKFNNNFGLPEGVPFTLWTTKWVYFPICYDGAESVGSVPRDPCDKITEHVGGW